MNGSILPASVAPLLSVGKCDSIHSLSTVPEIKEAIAKLSPEEYCELMAALRPAREDDKWDKEMQADAEAGRLNVINRRALAEHEAGHTEEWP